MAEPQPKPTPEKGRPSNRKYIAVAVGVAAAGAIAVLYFVLQQPDIRVIDYKLVSDIKMPQAETVYNLGRVSHRTNFDYSFQKEGIHNMQFSNTVSIISVKYVSLS